MENVNKTPIWFMRQAGRYLPEYRSIRSQHPDFLKLCLNPKVASEISLQPIRRFDIDFIISADNNSNPFPFSIVIFLPRRS